MGPRAQPQSDIEGGIVKDITVSSVKKLSRSSSLSIRRRGDDLINTSWYPNLQTMEVELHNKNLDHICYLFIFILFLAQLQIKRSHFLRYFLHTFNFFLDVVPYLFRYFSEANLFSVPWKVGPHAHQEPVRSFTSHQQSIELNDQLQIQSSPNKVSVFE